MRYAPQILIPPTAEPITSAELQCHLRTEDFDDSYLEGLIKSARRVAEDEFELAFMTQSWRLVLDDWWVRAVELPRPPIQVVDKVEYLDETVSWVELAASQYLFDPDTRLIQFAPDALPLPTLADGLLGRVRVDFTSGFKVGEVPDSAKHGLLMLCGHFYENREALTDESITNELELAFSHLMYSVTEDYL